MSVLEQAFRGQRVVVCLPPDGIVDWVPAAEVLLMEGFRTWQVPSGQLSMLPDILSLYARRARVGVGQLVDPDDVRAAVDAGAHFLSSPVHLSELVEAAGDVPLLSGALTPQEIAAALAKGAAAVQVSPADVMGSGYARSLPPMFPRADLVAAGRLERYQAEMWLQAGARAVSIEGVILQPETGGKSPNEPAEVRRRCQGFVQLLATPGT
ncbi:MAG: hypothetical protein L0G22_05865 [Propionibacteriaceae bacterium]|nr:hypothetical protein [Propionibacteriaceae bacterium]